MTTEEFKHKIELRVEQFNLLRGNHDPLFRAVEKMEASLREGKKILVFGNGGSSTQASHLAAELVNKFYFQRDALAAMALTTDVANITSIANDMDYKFIFSRQLEALGRPGDVAVGLSTSGTSRNVLEAFKVAKRMNIQTVALCGQHTASLEELGVDVIVSVPCPDTPTIQEMHLFFLHAMAEILESHFFGGQ